MTETTNHRNQTNHKPHIRLFATAVILAILSLIPHIAYATNKVAVRGYVTDENGEQLTGVTVMVKGTQIGTATDVNGEYTLIGEIPLNSLIVFSSVGMEQFEVEFEGQSTLNVTLNSDPDNLSELVVTPNSNINSIDIRTRSGLVQTVDMKRLNEKPMIDMGLALQGQVPGMIVTNTGDLGSKPTIRIRGNQSLRRGDSANEPLYILDGKEISPETFMNLNPQDIREIKVLKDAAACALYGIKAANGVIEISSQRGSSFGTTDVSYSFNMGVTFKGRRGVTVMNSTEKLELERLMKNEATPGYLYSADYITSRYSSSPDLEYMISEGERKLDSLRAINTDWFNELMRTSIYQRHNLSVRGGNERTSYFLSGNFSSQGGMVKGNNVQRAGVRLGIDQQIANIGFFSVNLDGGYSETKSPNGSSFTPASLVYNLNPYETPESPSLWSYPNRQLKDLLFQYSANSTDKHGGVSSSLNIKPLQCLEISGVAGIDFILTEGTQFTPASSYSEQQSGFSKAELGKLNKYKNTVTNFSYNVRILFNKIFNDIHDVTLSVNSDYYMTDNDNVSITGYGVGDNPSAALINQSLTGSRKPAVGSLKEKFKQLGFGGVAGYTLSNTYDLFASYKLDASSVLPSDKRWNAAWAVGAGWIPSQYAFLRDNKFIQHIKIKGSFGKTASLAGVSAASAIATFAYLEDTYSSQRILQLLALHNTNLKPEHTTSYDAGINIGFLKHFTLDAQWYRRQTADALLDVPIAASNGFNSMKQNIGVLRNEGIELSASLNLSELSPDFRMRIGASVAYNKNTVVDLYYTDKLYTSEDALIPDFQIGKPYDILYGLKWSGVNSITGLPIFIGKGGREIEPGKDNVSRDDFISLGHTTPPYSGTINLGFTYKNLELDADFYWVSGGIRQYNSTYIRSRDDVNMNAVAGLTEKMWFNRGDLDKIYHSPFYSSSAIMTLSYANTNNTGSSDFLRLSMLSLRYRIPSRLLDKTYNVIKYASVAIQASNLFTITRYNESDPETGQYGGAVQPVLSVNFNLTF